LKAGERERKTYLELLLKDEGDGDGGLANQCYFLPLYFCFWFTSPLFLLFSACLLFICFFYFSCSLCLYLFLFLLVSLCIICVSSFFIYVFLYYLFVVLPFFVAFVCLSWFLWVCIGWLDQQPTVRGSWSSFLLEEGHKSLCLLCLCFFFTRVDLG
jgi:hypothetical protein